MNTLTNCDLHPNCGGCKYRQDCEYFKFHVYQPCSFRNHNVVENLEEKVKEWDEMPTSKLIYVKEHIGSILGMLLQDIDNGWGTLEGIDLIADYLKSLLDKCEEFMQECPTTCEEWLNPPVESSFYYDFWERYADFYYRLPAVERIKLDRHLYPDEWGTEHLSYWNGALEDYWFEPIVPVEEQLKIFEDLAKHAPSDEQRAEWFIEDDMAEYDAFCDAWENYYAGL